MGTVYRYDTNCAGRIESDVHIEGGDILNIPSALGSSRLFKVKYVSYNKGFLFLERFTRNQYIVVRQVEN